jgi:serine/threonine-protein kinase
MTANPANGFLDRLQRSGLVSEHQMAQLRQGLEEQGVDFGDDRAIARALVENERLTSWQAEKLLQGKYKGLFLGAYRLLKPLGKGRTTAVFLAQNEHNRRRCAVKVFPYGMKKGERFLLERFLFEAQALAVLDHQNIVRAYDVGRVVKDDKDICYLAMEYIEGRDMQALVRERGPLEYVQAAELLRQAANGLAHAHENGLVHRDVEPANLMVDNRGVLKILDLGSARFFDEIEDSPSVGEEGVVVTIDYMSPEHGIDLRHADHRSDIYSLGCTAYFMLTGHPPFPDGTAAQRLVAHQVNSPNPIADERADAPLDLAAIVDKMMAKKPEDRFQSAPDVAAALTTWLSEHGGEDWRRQHGDIAAESGLLKLLLRRKPT